MTHGKRFGASLALGLLLALPAKTLARSEWTPTTSAGPPEGWSRGREGGSDHYSARAERLAREEAEEQRRTQLYNAVAEQVDTAWGRRDYREALRLLREQQGLRDGPNVRANIAKLEKHFEIQGYYDQANADDANGDYQKALKSYKKALAANPEPSAEQREFVAKYESYVERQNQITKTFDRLSDAVQDSRLARSTKGLKFGDSGPAATPQGLKFGANIGQSTPEAAAAMPTAPRVAAGVFGTHNAQPDLVERDPSGEVGTNTKAGDQLRSAAAVGKAGGDLTPNYDGGTAVSAGSLGFTRSRTIDLSSFSEAAKNDPLIIATVQELGALQAKRSRLEVERDELTRQRNGATDPDAMAKIDQQLKGKDQAYQANLLTIAGKKQQVAQRHREIDLSVAQPSQPVAKKGETSK